MSILIPTVKRHAILKMQDWRERGYTYAQIADRMGKSPSTVAKYDRVLERYGIEAFAK